MRSRTFYSSLFRYSFDFNITPEHWSNYRWDGDISRYFGRITDRCPEVPARVFKLGFLGKKKKSETAPVQMTNIKKKTSVANILKNKGGDNFFLLKEYKLNTKASLGIKKSR